MAKYIKTGTILTVILLIAVIYLITTSSTPKRVESISLRISVPEARARRFGLIIDVRTPKERELLGYYPNSIPISLDKLSSEIPLDISSKNTHILVYSNGDNRAALGADLLYKMGYKNVRYITQTYLSLLPGSSY